MMTCLYFLEDSPLQAALWRKAEFCWVCPRVASWLALGSRRVEKGNIDLPCTGLHACTSKNVCVARNWICVYSPPPPPNVYAEALTPSEDGIWRGSHWATLRFGRSDEGRELLLCFYKKKKWGHQLFSLFLPLPVSPTSSFPSTWGQWDGSHSYTHNLGVSDSL